ncbi:glycoside hydrolase family 13 protein [Suillus subalutaceus]|uniref:glycoside hydrolase family 13 protein n=1 Tax=Suillus subalutaceus TaxID=48586 RepID=UPI001B873546|nr:glycoside hydrolase family 13 protein [Suillus subalutaceus]KAG1849422.1 glycoside hydrolase family 13 protein [Suillus subalutaceus]
MAKASEEVDTVAQKQVPSLPLLKQTDSSTSHAFQTLDHDAVTPKTPADEGKEFFLSARSADEQPICVYELKLDPDGGPNKDRSYIRLPPAYTPYILRVSLDAGTPASKNGVFKTNFPLDGGVFGRNKFVERELPSNFSKPIQVDLPISHAGAFKYWVEYDGEVPGERAKGREGYFNIDPILRTKARSTILSPDLKPLTPAQGGAILSPEIVYLPLDGLAILTVVSKWMGPISNWREHFTEAGNRGYTMLHWTPLQERGSSDSPYSIKDQKHYDPSIFMGSVDPGTIDARVKEILRVAKEEYGLLNLTDVVLNHTASDSPWLVDHPEAGHSPANTPNLTPAFELDNRDPGIFFVRSEADIDVLMTSLAESIKARNMWQYYVLDIEREKEVVKGAIKRGKFVPWSGPDVAGKSIVALAENCLNELGSRYGARSDGEMAAGLLKAASVNIVNDDDTLVEIWGRVVDVINVPLYEEWEKDAKIALDHVKDRLKYIRLEENGPKLGEISASCPLNFALPPSKAYLRREVSVWSDCVKLRYGSGPADNPWLWEHMTSYVRMLAATFDGFRIDNCHSTPAHVGVAMLDAARTVNPDLYVCAELFTGSEEMDLLFVQRLGINSLVREAGNAWDPKEFSRVMYRFGACKTACAGLTNIEELDPPFGKGPTRPCIVSPLNGSVPHALMYDLTHDNESYLDKRSAEHALSVAGIVTFGYCAVASVKGFDDLYPKLLNLVEEKRQYELTQLGENSGIARAKRLLNGLHREMVLVIKYILVQRMHPTTQKGYLLIAHTAFSKGSKDRGIVNTIELSRTRARFVYGASVEFSSYETPCDSNTIRGLPGKLVEIPDVVVPQIPHDVAPFCRTHILIFEVEVQNLDEELDTFCASDADKAFGNLDLVDLNVVLYRADGEERDATSGVIADYCGLEGWMHPLRHIMKSNDLGHPLCENFRQGLWALDYIYSRLQKQTIQFPKLRTERIKASVPSYLRPKYFAILISTAYKAARHAAIEQCSEFVYTGHDFTQNLAMCAIQMHGRVQSASLDPAKSTPSLAAGLPHFGTGWARCWGPRRLHLFKGSYNSRDSPWWMYKIFKIMWPAQPDGLSILSEPVKRRFPVDDTWVAWDDPRAYTYTSTLAEIIQEILQRHASGIAFREYNAGPNLDMQMKDEGFNINIRVDWETGFIFGGNQHNCGTWMDKMGESEKAGTKGVPGTPRDGAPVEITGLLKINGQSTFVTYKAWGDLIQQSFERCYYVPLNAGDDSRYDVDPAIINRRGIYKDVYGSGPGREWSDYQFRPNFPIAMTVAPELFHAQHALQALRLADQVLRSSLGMKTLDASDMQYRPQYDNSNDTTDRCVAKGLNYHNGPEWGWPLGYFLRAYLYFDTRFGAGKEDTTQTLHYLHKILLTPKHHIQTDPWAGIPELTNKDGQYCADSCNTQAWSASTLLDFLEEVHRMESCK